MSQNRFLIAGLGNPGEKYAGTRHNIGFMVVDFIVRKYDLKIKKHELFEIAHLDIDEKELVLMKPLTFMNRSGLAVKYGIEANNIVLSNLLVISDDLALPFGRLRLRAKGSSGGHNGLQSIIDYLQSNQFPRLRVGIKPETEIEDVVEFVLSKFTHEEMEKIDAIIERAAEAVIYFVRHGAARTMNAFN
jgi:PTH1 family peptidyl-tRNA hydrolase